jgi:hypothetical protein
MSRARFARAVVALAALSALTACGGADVSGSQPPAAQPPAATPTQSQPPAQAATQAPVQTAAPAPSSPAAKVWLQPPDITDADIPPLPAVPFAYARPVEIVRAVYVFAAKHPEVLSHVPCFCGCESRGHRHNDDCFVTARDARGRPTVWEPHGVG